MYLFGFIVYLLYMTYQEFKNFMKIVRNEEELLDYMDIIFENNPHLYVEMYCHRLKWTKEYKKMTESFNSWILLYMAILCRLMER